jgi:hypothetical protein
MARPQCRQTLGEETMNALAESPRREVSDPARASAPGAQITA